MIWSAAIGGAFKAAVGFLRAIPWPVYAVLAILLAGWWWGEQRYDAGVLAERTRWEEAQRKANAEAAAEQARRDAEADTVNQDAADRGNQVTTETRTETASAVERVRYETRTLVVPADCPVALPERVQQEGRAAVDRARAAGDRLRAGRD